MCAYHPVARGSKQTIYALEWEKDEKESKLSRHAFFDEECAPFTNAQTHPTIKFDLKKSAKLLACLAMRICPYCSSIILSFNRLRSKRISCTWGSGCGTVDGVVAFDTRGLWFIGNLKNTFIYCKLRMQNKRGREWPIKKSYSWGHNSVDWSAPNML